MTAVILPLSRYNDAKEPGRCGNSPRHGRTPTEGYDMGRVARHPKRPCATCGALFQPRAARPNSTFCSRACVRRPITKLVDRTCAWCGEMFRDFPSNAGRQFCSRACRHARRDARQANGGVDVTHIVYLTCERCDRPFVARRGIPRRYCSTGCAYAAPPTWQMADCRVCGSPFKVTRSRLRLSNPQYCSKQCEGNGRRIRTERRECEHCGETFVHAKTSPGRFCSRACRDASMRLCVDVACEVCGTVVAMPPSRVALNARFCSQSCAATGRARFGGPSKIATAAIDLWMSRAASPLAVPEYRLGRWQIDLAFPLIHLALELDGCYWHGLPDAQARDAEKDADLAARGWTVRRIEIERRETAETLAEKIEAMLEDIGGDRRRGRSRGRR